jgi:hypothetical protein
MGVWGRWEPGSIYVSRGDTWGLGKGILAELKYQREYGRKHLNVSEILHSPDFYVFVIRFEPIPWSDSRFVLTGFDRDGKAIGYIVCSPGDAERLGHEAWHQIIGQYHPESENPLQRPDFLSRRQGALTR